MFYKIIIGDRFITVLIIFLFALGIWLPSFLSSEIIKDREISGAMPLFDLFSFFLKGNLFLSKLLAFGLVLFEAFLLVRINAKFVLIQKKTFLPALFFIIIAGYSPFLLQWNPVLPAAFFIIMVLEVIFQSYKDEPNTYRLFEAGMLLGLGSMFYAPLVYLLAFIWFACMVQRPFYWREYLFPFLGLLVPYVFFFAYLFFEDKSIPEFLEKLKSYFVLEFAFHQVHWIYWIFSVYLAFLIFLSSVYQLKVFQFRKIYIRDYFMVLFWLFITTSFVYIFLSGFNIGITYVIGISLSYILTNYFINARENFGNKFLFYLLLGFVVFMALNNLTGIL